MTGPAFRFAPSPNGMLHLGHAWSALLNREAARRMGGRFLIRIEDIDTLRCTPALAEAALDDLAWLGIVSDEPVLYQSQHLPVYHAAQDKLRDMGLLYPCFCTRKDIAEHAGDARDPEGQPLYPGTCKSLSAAERDHRIADGLPYALRLDMARALQHIATPLTFIEAGETLATDPSAWGDVVLVRKDIGTSYHIAVCVDDARQAITHVIRGRDLFHATAIHRLIQTLLGLPEPRYWHHELISDEAGRKLSKSFGSTALADLRAQDPFVRINRKRLKLPPL
jgi:glutamyl-Q tRNA(Asp) synthetase